MDSAYPLWKAGVRRLLGAFGLDPDELHRAMAVYKRLSSMSRYADADDDASLALAPTALAEAERLDAAATEWQALNTAVFWHVLPSLDLITSPHPADTRKVESLYAAQIADGAGLLDWLDTFVSTAGTRLQRQLKRVVASTALPLPPTRASLSNHAEKLFQGWQLIAGHDPGSPASLLDYWDELLDSIPTAADGAAALLTLSLRGWLVRALELVRAGPDFAAAVGCSSLRSCSNRSFSC